jgi:tRNA threonylcarbamoyladenosine biosynthesis protein TsaB
LLLALDATTYRASVAVFRDWSLIAERDVEMRGAEKERLMPAVDAVLHAARVSSAELTGLVCAGGPGSFTSLRIAASIAKGMATALSLPLLAVPSLALIAAGYGDTRPSRLVASLDALRGERYVAAVDQRSDGMVIAVGDLQRVGAADCERIARELGGPLVGPDVDPPTVPHARALGRTRAVMAVVDLDGWEPTYGRLAEAQVKWERAHGRPLSSAS